MGAGPFDFGTWVFCLFDGAPPTSPCARRFGVVRTARSLTSPGAGAGVGWTICSESCETGMEGGDKQQEVLDIAVLASLSMAHPLSTIHIRSSHSWSWSGSMIAPGAAPLGQRTRRPSYRG